MNTGNIKMWLLSKVAVSFYWIIAWPYVSMIFKSNTHYPSFLKPIGIFFGAGLGRRRGTILACHIY